MNLQPTFQGEVMLAGWSETHNGGAKVTFWLQDSEDLDAFKAMTVAKGKTAGQRLAIVAVEIGDDEQPVQPAQCEEKLKGGELAKLAGIFCDNPTFQDWCGASSIQEAAEWVRKTCGVQSRAALDHSEEAAKRFHGLVRIPFSTSRQ